MVPENLRPPDPRRADDGSDSDPAAQPSVSAAPLSPTASLSAAPAPSQLLLRILHRLLALLPGSRRRQARYQRLFDDNPCISYLVDPVTGRIVLANRAAIRYWGCAPEALPGKSIADISLLPPDTLRAALTRFATRELSLIESQHRVAGGAVRDVVVYGAPLPYGGKMLVHFVVHDVTQRKRLRAQQLQTVLEASADAVLIVAASGTITYANRVALAMFGYIEEGLAGRAVEVLVPAAIGQSHRAMREAYHAAPRPRAMAASRTLRAVRRDGSTFPVEISLSPLETDGERAVIATVQDITERQAAEDLLRETEQRWKFALEGAGDGVWDWNVAENKFTFSPRYVEMLGYTLAEFGNGYINWEGRLHPEDLPRVRQAFGEHIGGKRPACHIEARMLARDGSWKWCLLRGTVVSRDAEGRATRMIGTQSDISERKDAEEALQLAAMVYQNSAEAMMVTDANNNIVAINPAFTRLTGYSAEEVVGRNPRFMSSGRHDVSFYKNLWDTLRSTGTWQGQITNRRKSGEEFIERLIINTIHDERGQVHRYVALFSDITEKTRLDEMVWQQANFDPLTNLPNRRMSRDRLEHEIRKARRSKHEIGLLFVDLDRFKEVNDTLGHHMGDQLLVEAASRIASCVRESDTVARLGGDEFIIIMGELNGIGRLQAVAQNIIDKLNAPFSIGSEKLYTTASVGITVYPHDAADSDTLLKNADQAMYEAKSLGRNRFCYFTRSMQEETDRRVMLARDLREALANHEFEVHFQPIFNMHSGLLEKAEALLRWRHPREGYVPPDVFIPIAESTGLIVPIGNWLFGVVARLAAEWSARCGRILQLSINVSPAQFHGEEDMPMDWIATCHALELAPRQLVVEITEGVLLREDPDVKAKLRMLHDAGIELAIDDFGTGYSSLAYLKKFDLDYIKIDRSFIRDLERDESNRVLCEAIIAMAHKLGLRVVAEGVETEAQRDLLRAAGCDFGQGYLCGRPMPVREFEALLAQAPAACSR